jgi:hypothetical protein
MPFKAKITVWQFPKRAAATKRFLIDAEGRLQKVSPRFVDGLGRVVEATLPDIARGHLASADQPAVLIYSVPKQTPSDGRFVIASTATAREAGFRADRVFRGLDPDIPVVTRTLANFERPAGEPGFLLIDVDGFSRPLAWVIAKLAAAWPEIVVAPVLSLPSSSGFVCLQGETPRPSGWHVIIGISDTSDAARALDVLFERLWLVPGAHHVIVSARGAALEKTLADRAIGNLVQPHFFQAPLICEGVTRQAPQPSIRNADAPGVDTRLTLPDLSFEEQLRVSTAKAAALSAAQPQIVEVRNRLALEAALRDVASAGGDIGAAIERHHERMAGEDRGNLDPKATSLHFDSFGWQTADDLSADPAKYHGQTLADPVEPEYGGINGRMGRNKAICHLAPDRMSFTIRSFAHSAGRPNVFHLPLINPRGNADAFTDVAADGDLAPMRASVLDLFAEVRVPSPGDVAPEFNGFVSPSGIQAFDTEAADVVRIGPKGDLLFHVGPADVERSDEDEGAAAIAHLIRTGRSAKVIVCGDGSGAIKEALSSASDARPPGARRRVDIYGGTRPKDAYALARRADHCLKPKALNAVTAFAPRSTGSILCARGQFDICPRFEECGFIDNRKQAADAFVVHGPAALAATELNGLLGETAAPLALFLDPAAAVSVKLIAASDLIALGGVFSDFAAAVIAGRNDTAAAIRTCHIDRDGLQALKAATKAHGVGATPASTEGETLLAVQVAEATKETSSAPRHEIAFAVLSAIAGEAAVTTSDDGNGGFLLSFTITQILLRAAHHNACAALIDVPMALCRADVIGMRLFGEPAIAVSGGRRRGVTIAQVFNQAGRPSPSAIVVALAACGLKPALVSREHQGAPVTRGVPLLHPSDDLPEDVDVIVWMDRLVASDISILRTAATAGLEFHGQLNFEPRAGVWSSHGKRFTAQIKGPADDGAAACWQVECWRDLDRMLGSREGLAAIVFDNVPPVASDVELLFDPEDAEFSGLDELLSFVCQATGKDSLEAAEAVCAALADFPDGEDAILELALSELPMLSQEKRQLAKFIAKIKKRTA